MLPPLLCCLFLVFMYPLSTMLLDILLLSVLMFNVAHLGAKQITLGAIKVSFNSMVM